MTKLTLLVSVLLAALAVAGTATAAPAARDPRVPALQQHVRALQAQVDHNAKVLNFQIDLATCKFTYQSHFNYGVLNIFALMLGQPPYPDNTQSDQGACSRVGLPTPRFLAGVSPLGLAAGLAGQLTAVGR